jgi:hypothetical protein
MSNIDKLYGDYLAKLAKDKEDLDDIVQAIKTAETIIGNYVDSPYGVERLIGHYRKHQQIVIDSSDDFIKKSKLVSVFGVYCDFARSLDLTVNGKAVKAITPMVTVFSMADGLIYIFEECPKIIYFESDKEFFIKCVLRWIESGRFYGDNKRMSPALYKKPSEKYCMENPEIISTLESIKQSRIFI